METDIDYAIKELEHLKLMLEQTRDPSSNMNTNSTESLPMPTDLEQPVTLQATIDPSLPPVTFHTTFGRELWFCSLHAVMAHQGMSISSGWSIRSLHHIDILCFHCVIGPPLCNDQGHLWRVWNAFDRRIWSGSFNCKEQTGQSIVCQCD